MRKSARGFIASVEKPRNLKMQGVDERVGVDLFVNGRLRETNILKHIPTSRVVENYLYGQIHFDELDDGEKDRFPTGREGVVADDPEYKSFLEELSEVISEIMKEWDGLRIKHRQDGDPENERIKKQKRKGLELFHLVSGQYKLPEDSQNKEELENWINELAEDATFNFQSYVECFMSENLFRKYIDKKDIALSKSMMKKIQNFKDEEKDKMIKAKMNIDIRKNRNDNLSYLGMRDLANEADKSGGQITFKEDAEEYAPIRNAVAHTALLTDEAKLKLTTVYDNIRAGIIKLLS